MWEKRKYLKNIKSVIRKLKIVIVIVITLDASTLICTGISFAESKTEPKNEIISQESIQNDVVENVLEKEANSNSTGTSESEDLTATEESVSQIPENKDLEKTSNNSSKNTKGVKDSVVSKITVSNTGIVLKNDGSYLLMDTPKDYVDGTYDPDAHVKEKGLYDENTIIEISNTGNSNVNELYSERKSSGVNTIQQIIIADGTHSELTILSNSALEIHNNLEYGIKVSKLIIGEREELDWKPVNLNVTSNKIGIHTIDGTDNITGNVHTSAEQAGISITDENPPIRDDFSAMAAFKEKLEQGNAYGQYTGEIGTSLYAEGTGSSGSGAIFTMYTLNGSELTGKSFSSQYGIFSTNGATVETKYGTAEEGNNRSYEACLFGEANNGIGVFIDGMLTNYGGKITGTSLTGNGVEANFYESHPDPYSSGDYPSELNGSTDTGFGILLRSFFGEQEAGGMNLNSGKVNGHSKNGTGILTGDMIVNPDKEVDVTGFSAKGQGIVTSVMIMNKYDDPKPKVSIFGNSTGESSTTMSTIEQLFKNRKIPSDGLPVSAGIISLDGIADSGVDLSLKGTAPTELDGSCGIYSTPGRESILDIKGNKSVTVEAKGDCGIKAGQLNIGLEKQLSDTEGLITVNVDARSVGIETTRTMSITGNCDTERDTGSKIDIVASEGIGIISPKGVILQFMGNPNLYHIPMTISAKDIAINSDNSHGEEYYDSRIEFYGINVMISNAAIGIKGVEQESYNFQDSNLSIKTSKEGITLEDPSFYGQMLMISKSSMDIESGTYGIKTNNVLVNIEGGGSERRGHLSDTIDVVGEQYPIWFSGDTSGGPLLRIQNNKNYDETGNESPNELRIVSTSKSLQPDDGSYPTFYVENHKMEVDGSQENIKIIENYETKVSKPFNATPSTPYSSIADFNIEKYENYDWTAVRTDTDASIVVDTTQVAQNKLFTSDTDYNEAKLTARRLNHKTEERIFTDEDNVAVSDKILHEINMIVRREQQYTVTYDSNGADSGTLPNDSALYSQNDTVNVATQGDLVKADYKFVGWLNNVDGQIYQNPFLASTPTTYTMGHQNVTFTAQWQSDSIVEELELLTTKIPDNLKFGTHRIENSTDKTYYATKSGSNNENSSALDLTTGVVGVKDTRLSSIGWSLSVKQLTQFKTASNQKLNGAQLSFHVGQPDLSQSTGGAPNGVSDQNVTLTPNASKQLLIATGGQGKGIVELPIDKFMIEIPATAEKYASEYTTQLEWLVSNVP